MTRDEDEIEKRLQVFKENAEYVRKFNKKIFRTWTMGLTKFSDTTREELQKYYGGGSTSEEADTLVKDHGDCNKP